MSSLVLGLRLPCWITYFPRLHPFARVVRLLKRAGCLLSYNSGYLLQRNWIQICLMGEWPRDHLETLPDMLADLVARRRARKDDKLEPAGR